MTNSGGAVARHPYASHASARPKVRSRVVAFHAQRDAELGRIYAANVWPGVNITWGRQLGP